MELDIYELKSMLLASCQFEALRYQHVQTWSWLKFRLIHLRLKATVSGKLYISEKLEAESVPFIVSVEAAAITLFFQESSGNLGENPEGSH